MTYKKQIIIIRKYKNITATEKYMAEKVDRHGTCVKMKTNKKSHEKRMQQNEILCFKCMRNARWHFFYYPPWIHIKFIFCVLEDWRIFRPKQNRMENFSPPQHCRATYVYRWTVVIGIWRSVELYRPFIYLYLFCLILRYMLICSTINNMQ